MQRESETEKRERERSDCMNSVNDWLEGIV